MSRIGRKPIAIPQGVTITSEADGTIVVKGSKGELKFKPSDLVKVDIQENQVIIVREGEEREKRAHHGLVRALLQNMVTGVTTGFTKRLEINGVGYRAQMQGNKLVLSLGFSHPVDYPVPAGIEIKMDEEKKNVIVVTGIDKQKVGQTASEIRGFKPPEPYKGKGIRYEDEYVRRKAGKTAGKGA